MTTQPVQAQDLISHIEIDQELYETLQEEYARFKEHLVPVIVELDDGQEIFDVEITDPSPDKIMEACLSLSPALDCDIADMMHDDADYCVGGMISAIQDVVGAAESIDIENYYIGLTQLATMIYAGQLNALIERYVESASIESWYAGQPALLEALTDFEEDGYLSEAVIIGQIIEQTDAFFTLKNMNHFPQATVRMS